MVRIIPEARASGIMRHHVAGIAVLAVVAVLTLAACTAPATTPSDTSESPSRNPAPELGAGPIVPQALQARVGAWTAPHVDEPYDSEYDHDETSPDRNRWFACGEPPDGLPPQGMTVKEADAEVPAIEHVVYEWGDTYTDLATLERGSGGIQGPTQGPVPLTSGENPVTGWFVGVLTYRAWLDSDGTPLSDPPPEAWGTATSVALVASNGLVEETASRADTPVSLRSVNRAGPNGYAPDALMTAEGVDAAVGHVTWPFEHANCGGGFDPRREDNVNDPNKGGPWTIHAVTEVWTGEPDNVVAVFVDTGHVPDVLIALGNSNGTFLCPDGTCRPYDVAD